MSNFKSSRIFNLIFLFILTSPIAIGSDFLGRCARALGLISHSSSQKSYPPYMERILSDRVTPEGYRVIIFSDRNGNRNIELHIPGKPVENFTITKRGLADLSRNSPEEPRAYPPELLDSRELAKQDVLDVGCGAGTFVRDLAKISEDEGLRNKKKVGLDPFLDETQIGDPAHFREGRAERMESLPDASFDTVFSNYSVFLYDTRPRSYVPALREMSRVTRVGGRIRISPCDPRSIVEALQELPQLQLDPRLKIGSSPDNQIQWNGSNWEGQPFVELVRVR